ncbi:DMT family transporter [Pantoea cypripedii]|uniref:DMT family transporter n=1 Tax=Pantoea cypripedii TaxID=55209 RepID=UPI00286F5107|nr:DMT family transporter [Pantoea cypripedii]
MTSIITFVLLVAGGVALVIQNSLMAKISHSASSVLIALVINSGVGLILLLSLLAGKSGSSGFSELLQTLRPWVLLPGILGSFFVFAGITGYQNLGASRTIAVLVASQLVAGLGYDIYLSGADNLSKNAPALLGALLLIAGAFLVASRRF